MAVFFFILLFNRIISICILYIGHSIEAGWFLLQYAQKKNKPDLIDIAINKFILNSFKYGWDEKYGGLFYFLDVDGHRFD